MTQTALITGSAVRVGREIALHLAGRGYAIGLHCHSSREDGEKLAEEIRGLGAKCRLAVADMMDPTAATLMFDALDGLPPVTVLVHNASRFERDGLESMTEESFSAHMKVNLEAPLQLTREFVRRLPKAMMGNVICLLDGMRGWSYSGHFLSYALSKGGLETAIELLAPELAPMIRINGVALGPTLPGKMDKAHTFDKLEWITPLKRVSNPHEVCAAIDFLLASEGTTGQVIDLSGGMNLKRAQKPD